MAVFMLKTYQRYMSNPRLDGHHGPVDSPDIFIMGFFIMITFIDIFL